MRIDRELSIFSTLKEALFLWVRNFWYLAVATLIFKTPILFLPYSDAPDHSSPSTGWSLLQIAAGFSELLLNAINAAAVLGFLRRESLGETAWMAAWSSIQTYTRTLFRLNILIMIMAIVVLAFCIPLILLVEGLMKSRILIFVGGAMVIILLKYALANPLVVVDQLGAREALKRSLKMIKSYFWYVAGCYLFLGSLEQLIEQSVASPVHGANSGANGAQTLLQAGLNLLAPAWIILSWCMYLRINQANDELRQAREATAAN